MRRQVGAEIGEDEPTKDERFILLQKYGVTAPRIDRQIARPLWMSVAEFKRKMNEWFKSTKGLVTPPPQRPQAPGTKKWQDIRFKNPKAQAAHLKRHQRTNQFRRNFDPTKTATRLS